jgi:hypothetical protein
MVTKVLIWGHSFVKRLFDFIRRSNYHGVDFNMNLDPSRERVYLRAYPGGNLEVINSRGLDEIRRLHFWRLGRMIYVNRRMQLWLLLEALLNLY